MVYFNSVLWSPAFLKIDGVSEGQNQNKNVK